MHTVVARLVVRSTCDRCLAPVPLEGVHRSAVCRNCGNRLSIPAEPWEACWAAVLAQVEQLPEGGSATGEVQAEGAALRFEVARRRPVCRHCRFDLPFDVPDGQREPVPCVECGEMNPTQPFPSWLRERVPSAGQLLGAVPEWAVQGQQSEVLEPPSVIMGCPACQHGMKLDVSSPRVSSCDFCGADIYVPEDLWRHLHPVPASSPFWVRVAVEGAAPQRGDLTGTWGDADEEDTARWESSLHPEATTDHEQIPPQALPRPRSATWSDLTGGAVTAVPTPTPLPPDPEPALPGPVPLPTAPEAPPSEGLPIMAWVAVGLFVVAVTLAVAMLALGGGGR